MRGITRRLRPLSKVGITILGIFALAVQPLVASNVPLAFAAGVSSTVCTSGCDYTNVADAVAGASIGDTVVVKAGVYNITSTILVNKSITITGESGAEITTSGGNHVFVTTASDVTISGLKFTKTDSVNQNMINVQGANTTISSNAFSGQFIIGAGEISRALEVSTTTGLNIIGNTFNNLRQPAYINDSTNGSITNNYVNQTKGWVVIANTQLTFTANTWGTNATDIAIIDNDANPATPVTNNYPCSVVTTIKANNNNANIDNQVVLRHCLTSPAEQSITVRPSSLQGWAGVDDNGNGGSLSFVNGPAVAPLGSGSAELQVNTANQGYMLAKSGAYGGTKLSDITAIDYSTYTTSGNNLVAPSVQLNVTPDVNGTAAWYGRLVYEPYMNSETVPDGQWNTWNAAEGKWWLSKPSSFGDRCAQDSPCTFEELISFYPNIGINTGIYAGVGFKVGSSWTNYTGSVDNFHFASATNNDRYDFESAQPVLSAPVNLVLKDGAQGYVTIPTGLVSVTYNPVNAQLSWDPVADATGYTVEVYKDGVLVGGSGFGWNGSWVGFDGNNFGKAGDGAYTFVACATNPAALVSKVCSTQTAAYTYDSTAPNVPINGVPNGTHKTTSSGWSYSWSDESASGAVRYEYQASQDPTKVGGVLVNSIWSSDNGSASQRAALAAGPSIPSEGTGDGTWYWQVRAVDEAGNKSAWSTVWRVTVDTQKPATPTLDSPANNAVVNGASVTQSWNASNSGDVDHYVYQSYYDAAATNIRWTENFIGLSKTATNVANATYWWRVKAVDAAGNESNWSPLWKLTVDNDVPTATFVFPVAGPSAKSFQVRFSESVKKAEAENAANYFLNNWPGAGGSGDLAGDATVAYDDATRIATVTFTNADWYVSPEQQWGVRNIHDLAGNAVTETTAYSTPLVSPSAPGTLTLTSPRNSLATSWQWDAATDPTDSTNASGVKGYEYSLVTVNSTPTSWLFTSGTTTIVTVPADGSYRLYVRAIDNAGNTGNEVYGEVTIDTTAPTVTVNAIADTTSTTPTITGTTSELGGDVTISLDGVAETVTSNVKGEWSWTPTAALTVGEHIVVATATDAAGNMSSSDTTTPQGYWKQFAITSTSNSNSTTTSTAAAVQTTATTTALTTTAVVTDATDGDGAGTLGTETQTPGDMSSISTGDEDTNQVSAAGASDSKGTNDNTWNIFGLAWYVWLLILVAIVALWWFIAARRRRNEEN